MRTGITDMNWTDFNRLASIQAKVPKPDADHQKMPWIARCDFIRYGQRFLISMSGPGCPLSPDKKNPAEAG